MDLSDIFNASSRDVANSVSYAVYPDTPEKCSLEDLELECMWLVAPLLHGYVWEREPFQLHSSCRQPPPWQEQQQQEEEECLWGSFCFGDNLEDEWFAVFLLRHISQSIADVSIQVWDDDGEFLLIEAAVKLPRWLKPDGAGNRVWLRGGELHIIPPRDRRAPVQGLSRKQALQALQSQRPRATAASADVKECIHNRMAGFPERARQNMHAASVIGAVVRSAVLGEAGVGRSGSALHSERPAALQTQRWQHGQSQASRCRCLLPATAAAVLRKEPLLVGPAVHAFYLRDAQDMRAAARMAHFPPKDMVPVVVQFSRCMYALLQQQPYAAPKAYSMPLPHSRDHPPALLGLKLLTGMEILRSRASGTAHGTGQSAASCAAAGEDRPWEGARLALLRRGRLPQELAAAEGSEALARYRRLERYRRSCQRMLAAPHTIATLMAGVEKDKQPGEEEEEEEVVAQEDDDAWLYEGQAQLERELQLRERELQHPQDRSAPGPPRAVPEGDELDADELVRMMRRFVGVESGLEGAEAGSPSSLSDGEDSFSGESSCGEHEDTAARQLPAGDSGFSMMPAAFLSELERALEAMSAAEPPQTASGSCEEGVGMYGRDPEGGDGEAAGSSQAEEEEEEGREFEEAYAEALNWQLQGTKMAESFERVTAPESEASAPERRQDGREAAKDVQAGVRSGGVQDVQEEAEEEEEEEEDLRPVDVDMNLVKSLVESVSSQMGLPGPASNLSGMLGLNLHSAVAPAACAGTGLQQGPEDAGGGTSALGDPTTRNRPRPSHQQHPVSVLESRLRPASAANSAGVVQQPQQQADGSTSDMRSAAASGAAAAVNGGARSLDELLDELD